MKTHAQVAVIGGGIIGCSVLYHLTKLGWRDVVLLERSELTSGSTWHAAAGFGVLSDSTSMARLNHYTIECYKGLEPETGQSCGIHTTGGIYLAERRDRVDQLRIMEAKARYLGFDFEHVPLPELAELHPFIDTSRLRAAFLQPDEGHLDPSGVTQAFAKAARSAGAEVYRFCPVHETNARNDGSWEIVTPQGSLVAEHVVNAAGLWAREVAAMAKLRFPIVPMEHQYFVTEQIQALSELGRELPSISDRDAEYYLRQEGEGFLLGTYERSGKHWSTDTTPWDFGHELLPDDLDRISGNVEKAIQRMPVLEHAGIKRVINGPMVWSFDGTGLLGPVPGVRNYHAACGIMTGIGQGGGLGKCVAEWIVDGEPEWDMRAADVARFGDFIKPEHVIERSAELYGSRFRMHFPFEELTSGRPLRVRHNYAQMNAQGAVNTTSWGWETPLYFARSEAERDPGWSYRRARWFDVVAHECNTLRTQAGIIDVSPYAKLLVSGGESADWLNGLSTNRLPSVGRVGLAPMVNRDARFVADFSVTRLAEDRFLLISGGSAEAFLTRALESQLPNDGVRIESMSEAWAGFAIAGPRSRELLASMTGADVSNQALRFLSACELSFAGVDAWVLRVGFTGELGYEVYFDAAEIARVHAALADAAARVDAGFVGGLAVNALRIEKSYGSWFSEYTPDYDPISAGLSKLVDFSKPQFVGRDALQRISSGGQMHSMVALEIDAENADAFGGESISLDGRIVGDVTSGSYGHTVGKSLALGYVLADALDVDACYQVSVIGEPRTAKLLTEPAYDPRGLKMRS